MPKKKEMNRTSGTAKRKAPNMSQSERIGRQRQAAAANPGPRDKFNPAAAQEVVDTFGFGVGASGKFEFNPIATLGMALPLGKVAKAAKALRAVGGARNRSVAAGLTERLRSKAAGKSFGQSLAENKAAGGGPILQYIANAGAGARKASESVFPRIAGPGTTVRRGKGTVNQEGLEKMIAGGREPSREMLRIPQILKGTNEAYESIAQKAIKAAGKTPKRPRGK